jgi:S-DNA-T family DNA segregation ATPase FtsK/SpoIIIE
VTISTISRGFDIGAFLPDDIAAALRKRVREIGGLALIGGAAIAAAALASWSVKDPSLSYASGGPVHNLLGTGGAIAADLLMQLFGVAAIAIVLPVAFWGWRMFTHRPLDRMRLRLLVWLAGAPLAAGFIACLTRPATWPLPTGLGGVIGDAMLKLPALALGPLNGVELLLVAAIFGALTLAMVIVATGFGYHDPNAKVEFDERWAREAADPPDDDAERASISLGWLVHAALSLKARVGRLVTRRSALHAPNPARRPAPMPAV